MGVETLGCHFRVKESFRQFGIVSEYVEQNFTILFSSSQVTDAEMCSNSFGVMNFLYISYFDSFYRRVDSKNCSPHMGGRGHFVGIWSLLALYVMIII